MARAKAQPRLPVVEELHFRSDNAFLCLLLNRRTRLIRVIDFRAGALPAKRLFIQSVAKREGIDKAVLLVEKDEVSSWTRVGFAREGTIPGFYKRSDGHVVGWVLGEKAAPGQEDGAKAAEKTINHAKKIAKNYEEGPKGIPVKEIEEATALAARDEAWAKKLGVGAFDPFGRGADRMFLETGGGRSGKSNYLAAEYQDCFGHALVEILRSPTTEQEIGITVAGLRQLADEILKPRGIISAFAFAPVHDVNLAAVYLATGFRKTGLLARGILAGDRRSDAILWTRKLANPAAEDDEE
jgi:hypothetical protein